MAMPVVRISRKGADRAQSGHPWIFSSDVIDSGTAQAGDAVRVVDYRGKNIGAGHYSSTSQIAVRLLSHAIETIDERFLTRRIESALEYRRRVVSNSNAYRVIHAEGDLLPGLIVDKYSDWLVVQLLNQGMDRMADCVSAVLARLLDPCGIVARNDVTVRAKEALPQDVRLLAGDVPERVPIRLNSYTMHANLLTGQKTGVFLDQRENYLAAQRYARGVALDCFTATGGFGLHLACRCESVEAVDSSAAILAEAEANAAANAIGNIHFKKADVLDYLAGLVSARRTFDTIVLDPPAFTKSRSAVEGAARGYKEINLRALRLLNSGGVLVTCSCSHHMSEAHFLELIAAAALDCGKQLRVLERRTQSQDHPILLTVPETHYLKCLIVEVV
ncbi:MAG: class I SAM-dependent rRNA methyltransferase [Acidobacteriaceae bacterium]|nr:class I SAM-dependent rRNA methyltransferase [Acidobacteriaceae bacterium]